VKEWLRRRIIPVWLGYPLIGAGGFWVIQVISDHNWSGLVFGVFLLVVLGIVTHHFYETELLERTKDRWVIETRKRRRSSSPRTEAKQTQPPSSGPSHPAGSHPSETVDLASSYEHAFPAQPRSFPRVPTEQGPDGDPNARALTRSGPGFTLRLRRRGG
jgi:hypothetical protein